MIRNILSIISGTVTGIIVTLISRIFLIIQFPFPEELNWELVADQNTYIASIPDYGLWLFIATHSLGAFLTGLITSLIARKNRILVGSVALLAFLILLFFFIIKLTFPEWFLWADLSLTILFGYFGIYVGSRRTV